jgi:hypothetical protein
MKPKGDSTLPASKILPGPADLRHYPAHQLVAWQPLGVLDDRLLDGIGEWLCAIEKTSAPFKRFVDFTRLTSVAIRTGHVFEFARMRSEQLTGIAPVRSALFSEDWVGFGIAQLYEALMKDTPIQARAFRTRSGAATWLDVPATVLNLDDRPSAP